MVVLLLFLMSMDNRNWVGKGIKLEEKWGDQGLSGKGLGLDRMWDYGGEKEHAFGKMS